MLTLNSLTAANSVMIPVQAEYFALEGLGQLLNTIKIVRQHLNPELEIEGGDGKWRFGVWGRNVTNEYYWYTATRASDQLTPEAFQ